MFIRDNEILGLLEFQDDLEIILFDTFINFESQIMKCNTNHLFSPITEIIIHL